MEGDGSRSSEDHSSAAEEIKPIGVVICLAGTYWLAVLIDHWWMLHWNINGMFVGVHISMRVLGIFAAMSWCIGSAFRTASSMGRERDNAHPEYAADAASRACGDPPRQMAGQHPSAAHLGFCPPLHLVARTGYRHLTSAGCVALGRRLHGIPSLPDQSRALVRIRMPQYETAQVVIVLILLAVFPGLLINLIDPIQLSSNSSEKWTLLWQFGLNPFASWWVAGFSWQEWREAVAANDSLFMARLRAVAQGIALLTVVAGVFWLAARRRLEMEPRD